MANRTKSEKTPGKLRSKSSTRTTGTDRSRRKPKWLKRIRSFLTFPFRKARWGLGYWKPLKILRKRWDDLCRFVVWLVRGEQKQAKLGQTAARLRHLEWPSRKTLVNPLSWFDWLVSFIARWGLTRPKRSLVLGVPAVAFAIVLMTCISLVGRRSTTDTTVQYLSQLTQAVERNDGVSARFIADALIRLNPSAIEHQLNRAIVEEQLGNPAVARARMSDLAVHDNSPVAAMWLANSLGNATEIRTWPKEKIREYFDLLLLATKNAPSSSLPRHALSGMLETLGDPKLAYAALLPIAENDLETAYHVVRLEFQTGYTERARMRAQKVLTAYQSALASQPANYNLRIKCASLHTLMERSASAVRLLRDGLGLATNAEALATMNQALAEALAIDSQYVGEKDDPDGTMINRLRRLDEAMDVDPTNERLRAAIESACLEAKDSRNPEIRFRRQALVRRVDPEMSRFIKGTAALQQGNLAVAKELLAVDLAGDQNAPGLLNNLAHALSQGENPELEKALELSNRAVQLVPNHAYLRETRGQILFKMRRFRDAISDLEIALSAQALRSGIRPILAQAYDQVGEPEKSKIQRELLKEEAENSVEP